MAWLRLYVHGPAFIPTQRDSNYYPDFIALDTEGTYWVIEGKADDSAKDDGVSARRTPPRGGPGPSATTANTESGGYVFATEADIKQAAGSWTALLVTTKPE